MTLLRIGAFLASIAIAACSGSESDDDHEQEDASTSDGDATTMSPDRREGDAADSSCDSLCGEGCCASDQICCTDQHGHFPTCVTGNACP